MIRNKVLVRVLGVAASTLGSGAITQAQHVQNPSFEVWQATTPPLPAAWAVGASRGYRVALDSTVAHTGRTSLLLTGTDAAITTSQDFSQRCAVQVDHPTAWRLRAMVKADPGVRVALSCQLRSATKLLQTLDSRRWEAAPVGTGEWRQLELTVLLTPAVRHVVFGGSLTGPGQAWFDDVQGEAIPAQTPLAPVVQTYVDSLVALVQRHALVRDSVPWPPTQAALRALTAGMHTTEQADAAAGYLLEVLRRYGDAHSRVVSAAALREPGAGTPLAQEAPTVTYLGDGLGYVRVPAFNVMNPAREVAFATQLQAQIRAVDTRHRLRGWVVDLRENRGGNLYPMVAGLGPLLGEGVLGYFLNASRQTPWGYTQGEAWAECPGRGVQVATPYHLRRPSVPVAVLIGPHTGSSGEMVALSFRGRPHTRFVGWPTAGFATGNRGYPLPGGSTLFLAVSVAADRQRRPLTPRLLPDMPLASPEPAAKDPTLRAAKVWLNSFQRP